MIIGTLKETEIHQMRDSFHTIHNSESKTFTRIFTVWEAAEKEANNIQPRTLVARDMGKTCQMQLNEKKNKSGLPKNRSLTMQEG